MNEPIAIAALVFAASFAGCALLTRFAIAVFRRIGHVAPEDPWHDRPVALSAGIAIWLTVAPILWFALDWSLPTVGLAAAGTAMMFVGLIDDLRALRADLKLLLQFGVAIVLIGTGIYIRLIPWPALSIPITFLWIVGLTNAVNLIDNMDGLAPGVSAIAALFLGVLSLQNGDMTVAITSFALSGACGGFLLFNFPPARAFLGDTGSMFLGCTLAALTILSTRHHASSVFMALAAPVLILLVPIFNTTFVAVTRTLLGKSVSAARPDHINYRLLAHGLSQRMSIWTIYGLSALGGLMAVAYNAIGSEVFIGLALLGTVALFAVAVFLLEGDLTDILARFRVGPDAGIGPELRRYRAVLLLLLDLVLVVAGYYIAYLIRFEGHIPPHQMTNLAQTLPIFLVLRLGCFSAFGLYSVHWRYVGLADVLAIVQAVAVSSLLQIGVVFGLRIGQFSRSVLILDAMVLLMLVVALRLSTRMLRTYVLRFREELPGRRRTIILGAGDAGELAVRELLGNPDHGMVVIGLLDDDRAKRHLRIHGIPVRGTLEDVAAVVERHQVTDVVAAMPSVPSPRVQAALDAAANAGAACSVFQFRAAVVPLEQGSLDGIRVLEGGKTG
jgi:UDP-GlcNAc:undecaprenyl-phosphate/decaprenyl-phosphate GlcNAc-1-phosphate transferase